MHGAQLGYDARDELLRADVADLLSGSGGSRAILVALPNRGVLRK